MSYGKVDHDRFAFLVALFVLPSVGRAPLRSRERTEAAGWALTMVALAVVATYALAAVAKIRFGGWDWVDGATLTRAVLRRSTPLSEPLLDVPGSCSRPRSTGSWSWSSSSPRCCSCAGATRA